MPRRRREDLQKTAPPTLAAEADVPVVPADLIKGDWRRRLILPDGKGQLRLTPVKPVRGERATPPNGQVRYLDADRRNSA